MIQEELLKLLQSPENQSALVQIQNDELKSVTGDFTYSIQEGVPILLANQRDQIKQQSAQHEQVNTDFKYAEHYEKDAEVFDYFRVYEDLATRHENRRLHESILKQIPSKPARVLDVGSGGAWVAKHFLDSETSVISFDISTVNTIKALKKYPSDKHFAVVGDVYALPFKDATMDCIIAAEIIEHLANPSLFIASLLRVLKPNGKLIITTPYNENIAQHLCIHCNCPTPSNAHLHSFDERKILSLVPDEIKEKQAFAFSSKLLARLRTHMLLKYFPYGFWRFLDKIANSFIKKPARLMLIVTK